MKKFILLGFLALSVMSFANREVPEEIRKEIAQYALERSEGSNRVQMITSETNAYFFLQDELNKTGLTEGQKGLVKQRLKATYGAGNYTKMSSALSREVEYVASKTSPNGNSGVSGNIINNQVAMESKKEMENIINENKKSIPENYMNHFKSEASRLYPNNPYEQKRYIESSINTYKMFNK